MRMEQLINHCEWAILTINFYFLSQKKNVYAEQVMGTSRSYLRWCSSAVEQCALMIE